MLDKGSLTLKDHSKIVIDLIFETANRILTQTTEEIDLENKIVLAMAIRLKAEKFMISMIADDSFWKGITKHQTFVLFERYKQTFPNEIEVIKLLEDVNLMTPENIHVNSFMYEPILDMSNEHLKMLYSEILKLK